MNLPRQSPAEAQSTTTLAGIVMKSAALRKEKCRILIARVRRQLPISIHQPSRCACIRGSGKIARRV
jgi:hypothetical protein